MTASRNGKTGGGGTSVVLRKSSGRVIIINIIIFIKSRGNAQPVVCVFHTLALHVGEVFLFQWRARAPSVYVYTHTHSVYTPVHTAIYHFRAIESKKANLKTITLCARNRDDSMTQ